MTNVYCLLIRCCACKTFCCHAVAYGVKLFASGFQKVLVWCLAVNGVDHHLHWLDLAQGFKPWCDKALRGVVHIVGTHAAFHEHGLYDDVAVERAQPLDDVVHAIVGAYGAVHLSYIVDVHGVELKDVVVNHHQRVMNLWSVNERRVAEHRHFGFRKIFVS